LPTTPLIPYTTLFRSGHHFPVRHHHPVRSVLFASGRANLQPLIPRLKLRRAAEPLASIAKARLAAEVVKLQNEVRVVVRGRSLQDRKSTRLNSSHQII